ncbi:hypothetical protein HYDPIDRAFT_112418 [Hydnomerulius pinastri MD-312]|uniref:Uncharacterized protein n=1 Tax=Hydnomerulius pinastri MD-312 TaxID=994086 RepID=A0A0C9VEE0_9AGAM|nr:hypothetical protein HYDPIDRAFT_112418 [Hydnomerulius pinastri MD-312]
MIFLLFIFAYAYHAQHSAASPTSIFSNTISANSSIALATYSNSTFIALADTSSAACNDIHTCRTLTNIVWSCLTTIFACIWTAVHRNIPGPNQSWFSGVLEKAKVVVLTLLAPEWVLAWAIRQFLKSRDLAKRLEGYRRKEKVQKAWRLREEQLTMLLSKDSFDQQNGSIFEINTNVEDDGNSEEIALIQSSQNSQKPAGSGENVTKRALDAVLEQYRVARNSNRQWTTTHGFFVNMGGFHGCRDGKPVRPLGGDEVEELVKAGELIPPTETEIKGLGQADVLSKGFTIIQTLWFIIQCIARRVDGLPITQLEVMTLAYTTITIAMYAFWWHKPLNVNCPVRITVKSTDPLVSHSGSEGTRLENIDDLFRTLVGGRDDGVDLPKERQIPTFYGGSKAEIWNFKVELIADVIALFAAMVFGAIHMVAWSYAFPSATEVLIWRASAIAIVVIPFSMPLFFALGAFADSFDTFITGALLVTTILLGLLYIPARLLLLVISFTTLRSLPLEAYQTVQWTLSIPHIF